MSTPSPAGPGAGGGFRLPVRIGTRLFLALALPITLLIVAFALFEDGANRTRSREEVLREGRGLARTVQLAAIHALRDGRFEDVRGLIDEISNHENVIGVRLYDNAGRLVHAPANVRDVAPLPQAEVLRRLRAGQLVQERERLHGQPVLAWFAPLTGPRGEPLGASEVLQLESFVDEDADASSRAIAVFAGVLVALMALTVFVVTRVNVADPIAEMVAGVRGVRLGAGSARLPVHRDDELGRLAREFNLMCDRLESAHATLAHEQHERQRVEQRLRESERLADIGRFAAGLAHEIGTPLNVISGRAETLLRRAGEDSPMRGGLVTIVEQTERVSRTVRSVLDFARAWDLHLRPVDVAALLHRVGDLVRERAEAKGVAIEIARVPGLPPVAADPERLEQVLVNLAFNAIDAAPAGGRLGFAAEVADAAPPDAGRPRGPAIVLSVTDDGAGIAPEHLERVFDPFFTTKDVGRGTGLGLSIADSIAKEHGGWIELASTPGEGTIARVVLPLGDAAALPAERAS